MRDVPERWRDLQRDTQARTRWLLEALGRAVKFPTRAVAGHVWTHRGAPITSALRRDVLNFERCHALAEEPTHA